MACNSVATARAKVAAIGLEQARFIIHTAYADGARVESGYNNTSRYYSIIRKDGIRVNVFESPYADKGLVVNVNAPIGISPRALEEIKAEVEKTLTKGTLALIAAAMKRKAKVEQAAYTPDGRGLVLTVTTR